jgi:hypothetical protein
MDFFYYFFLSEYWGVESILEWTVLVGETEVLAENLPQRHFVLHKSHLPDPGRRGGKPATNHFSSGADIYMDLHLECTFLLLLW